MGKLGKDYEDVVADIVREMDSGARVSVGEWIEGPDGERELDVIVQGYADRTPKKIQIECRDYNPARRKIGIAQIDAIESKHRDLGFDVSLLCSNAGFSVDAIRKAKRVGIGLIGVMRAGDARIRHAVCDEIYIRHLTIPERSCEMRFHFDGTAPAQPSGPECIQHDGLSVADWLTERVWEFLGLNPVVRGRFNLSFRLKSPIDIETGNGPARLSGMEIQFPLKGCWTAQNVEIDATSGLYDWIRRTIRLGPNQGSLTYKDIKFDGGTRIPRPPDLDERYLSQLVEGEVNLWMMSIQGLKQPRAVARLNNHVESDDLKLTGAQLPLECYVSPSDETAT